MEYRDTVLVIPSLEPDQRLPAYVRALREEGFRWVVVVDDGSSEKTQPIFEDIAAQEGCTVLHHEVNKGKGVALKTAYCWIRDNLPEAQGIITADSDGQHAVKDCRKLAEKLCEGKRAVYLGARDFNLPGVPMKSKKGNHITSAVFKALYGQYLPDTQTGLRAFRREELDFMIDVRGERYEYEMNVLIGCARAGIPMLSVTIETIYENNNEGSHFHPVRDAWRIYKVLLGGFVRFMGSSLIATLADQGLFNALIYWLLPLIGMTGRTRPIWVATAVARVISAVLNFTLNKKLVFKLKGNTRRAAIRYTMNAFVVLCLSAGLVTLLSSLKVPQWLAKLVVDLVLYFINFRIQNQWVFQEDEAK